MTTRIALVTGGTGGIGSAICERLARNGLRVVTNYRDEGKARAWQERMKEKGYDMAIVPGNVADTASAAAMVRQIEEQIGPIDVLINNAGIIQVGPLEVMTKEDFARAMAVNFWGIFHTTMAVLPGMRERRSGRIVNVTSIGGKVAIPHLLPYSTGKFAAVGFSEGLAAEVAKDGIVVTTVVPGLMRTGSPANALFKSKAEKEYAWFTIGDSLPLTSMSAERAARRIVKALRRGETEVTLSWQAKTLRLAHGIVPATITRVLGWANRLLPEPGGIGQDERRGIEVATNLPPSRLTWLSDRAAERNNEYNGMRPPRHERPGFWLRSEN